MKKALVIGIILLFLGVGFQPATSQPNVKNQLSFVDEEKENIIVNQDSDYAGFIKRKVYLGCDIDVGPDGNSGGAILFPGILRLKHQEIFVIFNSGIAYDGADPFIKDELLLDKDKYEDFLFINIIGFTGTWEYWLEGYRRFSLVGRALYVVIYYVE